jgi:hypothetical protein
MKFIDFVNALLIAVGSLTLEKPLILEPLVIFLIVVGGQPEEQRQRLIWDFMPCQMVL